MSFFKKIITGNYDAFKHGVKFSDFEFLDIIIGLIMFGLIAWFTFH